MKSKKGPSKKNPSKRIPLRLSDSRYAVEFVDKFPIITQQVPQWETLNPLLEKGIRASGDKQSHSTNVKADMTDFRMWEPDQPAFEQFQVICKYALEMVMANSPPQAVPFLKPSVTDCWGVVYKKDEYTLQHDHWPSMWSFTYYVNVTDDCAPIVFPNAKLSVQPKNGMICMFPGWIAHYVPKQEGSHERVMIAGNIAQKF